MILRKRQIKNHIDSLRANDEQESAHQQKEDKSEKQKKDYQKEKRQGKGQDDQEKVVDDQKEFYCDNKDAQTFFFRKLDKFIQSQQQKCQKNEARFMFKIQRSLISGYEFKLYYQLTSGLQYVLDQQFEEGQFKNLSKLSKSLNKLSQLLTIELIIGYDENYFLDLIDNLSYCDNLDTLEIFLCRMHIDIPLFCCKFSNIQNLKNLHLDLSQNRIRAEGIILLAESLSKCHNLEKLKLNLFDNYICNEEISLLGRGLGKCLNLVNLNINLAKDLPYNQNTYYKNENEFNDEGLIKFFDGLSNCKSLKIFSLYSYSNWISDEGLIKGMIKCQHFSVIKLKISHADFDYEKIEYHLLKKLKRLVNYINIINIV
ncbi:hypothetical protein ABPG74_010464 [Tetrahymena malaccensis]